MLFLVSHGCGTRAAAAAPCLLRDPTVSRTQVAFSCGGDIWTANRDGGSARRLTSTGHNAKPAFSPDGSVIAFAREYADARAVYVIPSAGGEPRRLTYHPADLGKGGLGPIPDFIGWTPDGKHVVFNSRRAAYAWWTVQSIPVQLFTVPLDGGMVTSLPLAAAVQGSLYADGTRIAYVPNIQSEPAWKHYRGGQTTPIWIADLADSGIRERVPRDNSNDFNPLWVSDTLYFLSDRNGPVTLFAYDLKSHQVRQVVSNSGLDIKSAAASTNTIVYEQFGSIHLLDLNTGDDRALNIILAPDFSATRPHSLAIDPTQVRLAGVSPNGDRVLLSTHGEIITVQTRARDVRNLTRTPAVVERDPAWSPDGSSIAYFSDESGEYALHIRDPNGLGKVRKIDLGSPPGFFYSPTWSPDSGKVAYSDKRLNYWYVDLHGKAAPVHVDSDLYTDPSYGLQLAWSPDSRLIAYTKQLPSHLHAVFVYSIAQARSYQLSDGTTDVLHVAFDKQGNYLYFTASADVAFQLGWNDMSSLHWPVTRRVYAIQLKKSPPSSLAPDNGSADKMDIDFEGINECTLTLPIPAANYYDLSVGRPGIVYLVEGPRVDPLPEPHSGASPDIPTRVLRFDLRTRRIEPILDGVVAFNGDRYTSSFHISSNGETMLYAKGGQWFVSSATDPTTDASHRGTPERLRLSSIAVDVNPRAEWKHMFEQVWRDERDFFYDPGLHGLKLDLVKKRYAPFLDSISSRDDLNYLFSEMLGNLSVSHMWAFGGDAELHPQPAGTGLLGADYAADNGRYRFARIYRADPWDPESHSPLAQPGMNIRPGDYLLEVNGREVRATADVYSFFQSTAGKRVVLTVGSKPDGTDARQVVVTPLGDETSLRNHAWVQNNRRKVDQLSGGRVGYIYLPDTYGGAYASFNREYMAQVGKSAAIIDTRYNSGGLSADYIIDHLRHPLMNYWDMREGHAITTPQEAIFGPKVMLINEISGSGGDLLPWMFREAKLGPLIGRRTWGGLVGHYTIPGDLLDGGYVSTPDLAFYDTRGDWAIENHGVSPDIEVEDDPKAERDGHDPQLEKAVAVALDLLQKNPVPATSPHPPYPIRVQ